MSAFVNHKIGQINKEKIAVFAEGVDQEAYIEDKPGCDAVARGGPPFLSPPVPGLPVLRKHALQVLAHPPDCNGIAGRETGYGGAPASERCDALLIGLDPDIRDL